MYHPTLEEFKRLSKEGNLIPVYKEILADLETPVSAFWKISKDSDYAYLLESVEGGEKLGRYSFLGADPNAVFKCQGEKVTVERDGEIEESEIREEDPLTYLKKLMDNFHPVQVKELRRFYGGAVGYIGYDYVRHLEKIPDKKSDELGLPEILFVFTDTILIFDHVNHTIKVVSNAYIEDSVDKAYDEAIRKIEGIMAKLREPLLLGPDTPGIHEWGEMSDIKIESNLTKHEYMKSVEKAKEYIRAGDIFQVVLSQRFRVSVSTSPFSIYRALRRINPSPYMYYLKYKDSVILGSSPEILVRVDGNVAEVRPIAGTRPRGKEEEEDEAYIKDLLADPKERAEHIMLVDLGRNDLGRVCEYGSICIPELMIIEKYSHVMHIVSSIKGKVKSRYSSADVLRACFPAGTLTGAPKIRAMEIIDELEPVKRGPYGGCVGYFSFSGNIDTCITIRTIVFKEGMAYIQAGAGIVLDSDPAREYDETRNKAEALIKAIRMAKRDWNDFTN
ncbi:MAG: anthranilate synthase component I [bacterium]|nr:anthranilate synthase component I [bacterium]